MVGAGRCRHETPRPVRPRPPALVRLGAAAFPALAQPAGLGRVEALHGEAMAEDAAEGATFTADAGLDGDLVATAETARMTIRLAEAIEVRLSGGVRLKIDRFLARAAARSC